eukprot:5698181-Amphidinium_carterae.1
MYWESTTGMRLTRSLVRTCGVASSNLQCTILRPPWDNRCLATQQPSQQPITQTLGSRWLRAKDTTIKTVSLYLVQKQFVRARHCAIPNDF